MSASFDILDLAARCESEGIGVVSLVEPTKTIVAEGDAARRMYLLVDGHVEVSLRGQPVGVLHAPTIFGEMALFEDAPRSASVVALSDCSLLALDLAQFNALSAQTPPLVG